MIKRGAEHAAAMKKVKSLRPGVFVEVKTMNNSYRGYVKRVASDQLILLSERGGEIPLGFGAIVEVTNARSIADNARTIAATQRKGKR